MALDIKLILIVGIVLMVILIFAWAFFRYRKKGTKLNLKLLLVKLPPSSLKDNEQRDIVAEIGNFEQLLSSLSSLKEPFCLELAVHNSGSEIYFYLAIPRQSVDFVIRQIQGFFADAQVDEVDDYTIFNPNGSVAGAVLQEKYTILPIRTYEETKIDTFSPILSVFSKLEEVGDGACLQIIARPADTNFKKNINQKITRLKKGEKFKDVAYGGVTWKDIKPFFEGQDSSNKERSVDEDAVQALEKKIDKPLFETNVRLMASSLSKDRTEDLLLSIAGAFAQFSSPKRSEFRLFRPKKIKKLVYNFIFRQFDEKETLILNTEEIASIFHFPISTTTTPRLKWLKTKEAPPPDNLPKEGVIVGENVFRGERKLVRMDRDDRRRHFYVIGQTGTGKSWLMLNMALQDIKAGDGVCVIDPHGDLVDDILERMPVERAKDVIVFDPGDVGRPLGMNMLEYDIRRPEEKTFIVNEIQAIFNQLFMKETMGPMFEQYMRNSLLLLMEDSIHEAPTLMEVPRIFTDEEYRNKKIARITNPSVIDFWTKEAAKTTGEQGLANMAPYITSKFGNFIANDYIRPIISQQKSAFNFRQVMDERKILLVSLAKGKIGDINAGLLGMIAVGRLLMAALSRGEMAKEERKDFYLYIDEFQNFTTESISVILSEARKYRLNLILAHQFIAQLSDEIKGAVFGNVGSMATLRVGAPDTDELVKQFSPVFNERDLLSIENQNAFIKLLINGEPARPFNIKTLNVENGSSDVKQKLKELSRLTYGRDLQTVEKEILERLRS